MATTTTNLGLTKPALSESADVGVINDNSDKIDAEAGKARANLAATYSASSSYAVGDYCTRGGNLYRCTTAIGSGGEAWNSGHWTQVSVMAETVHKTGDETITGEKIFVCPSGNNNFITQSNSRYNGITFRNSSGENGAFIQTDFGDATNQTSNRLALYEYSPKSTPGTGNTGYYERYRLPAPEVGLSSTSSYYILTTKSIDEVTATTNANGNVSVTLPSAGIVYAAWSSSSDRICLPFASNNATATGKTTWYIKVFNQSTMAAVANTSVTVYYAYTCP